MSHKDSHAHDGHHSEPHNHSDQPATDSHHDHEALLPPVAVHSEGANGGDDLVAKAATIAVVGVGVALISAELIPGMLIGVAAALLPGIGPKMGPLFKSTLRAGYGAYRKTREMVSEAGEQIQDVLAEAKSEHLHPASPATPPPAAPHS